MHEGNQQKRQYFVVKISGFMKRTMKGIFWRWQEGCIGCIKLYLLTTKNIMLKRQIATCVWLNQSTRVWDAILKTAMGRPLWFHPAGSVALWWVHWLVGCSARGSSLALRNATGPAGLCEEDKWLFCASAPLHEDGGLFCSRKHLWNRARACLETRLIQCVDNSAKNFDVSDYSFNGWYWWRGSWSPWCVSVNIGSSQDPVLL